MLVTLPKLRVVLHAVATLALLSVACSDDDPTVSGPDETPPGISTVAPADEYHIRVKYTEPVTAESAEILGNYLITETGTFPLSNTSGASIPGDTLLLASAILDPDRVTLTLSSDASMAGFTYSLGVGGIADVSGNVMTSTNVKPFTGSFDVDQTPPAIVSRSPAPNATGVPIGVTITMKFSEPVSYGSFVGSTTLFPTAGGGALDCRVGREGTTSYKLTPRAPLMPGTSYTVSVNAEDRSGNGLNTVQWSFTTTNTVDTTPATLVSTFPPDLATNVNVYATLSFVFSEPMQEDELAVEIVPNPGERNATWGASGKTVTYQFSPPLLVDQQYLVTIYADGSTDFSGNELEDLYTVVFTTASALEPGSISGTITGHTGTAAADPAGALVLAASGSLFSGNVAILGGAVVDANGAYSISNLPDGVYFPLVFLDTTGDGFLLGLGDAVGGYGMDLALSDVEPDSVIIEGGTHATGVDFGLFDPSGIRGSLSYSGVFHGDNLQAYVGLFDTDGFDMTSTPVAVLQRFWPVPIAWSFSSLFGIPDGDYYVAAFLDVDGSETFTASVDPWGVYGGSAARNVVHIENGNDIFGILIPISDPANSASSSAVVWPRAKHQTRIDRMIEAVRKSGFAAK